MKTTEQLIRDLKASLFEAKRLLGESHELTEAIETALLIDARPYRECGRCHFKFDLEVWPTPPNKCPSCAPREGSLRQGNKVRAHSGFIIRGASNGEVEMFCKPATRYAEQLAEGIWLVHYTVRGGHVSDFTKVLPDAEVSRLFRLWPNDQDPV